jgi:hypothetical protein
MGVFQEERGPLCICPSSPPSRNLGIEGRLRCQKPCRIDLVGKVFMAFAAKEEGDPLGVGSAGVGKAKKQGRERIFANPKPREGR